MGSIPAGSTKQNTASAVFSFTADHAFGTKNGRDLTIRQAQEKYANGDFILGKLDKYGQRISIEIILPRKDKIGTVSFMSGWMVYPDGVIQNTTPYGDK